MSDKLHQIQKATILVSDGGPCAKRYARPSPAAAEQNNAYNVYDDELAE
jgi:hypothetical protein